MQHQILQLSAECTSDHVIIVCQDSKWRNSHQGILNSIRQSVIFYIKQHKSIRHILIVEDTLAPPGNCKSCLQHDDQNARLALVARGLDVEQHAATVVGLRAAHIADHSHVLYK
jgi:hypothetical protein